MASEIVIQASTATLVLEVSQTSVLEIGAAGPQGTSAVLADGVTSVTFVTSTGVQYAVAVDDDGVLTTTKL
jgi:hypothetical protein